MTKEMRHNFSELYEDLMEHQMNLSEATDAKAIVKELIDTSFGGDNESQMKAVQLLKGLATSDDPASNAFMKKLDNWTSGLKPENGNGDEKKKMSEGEVPHVFTSWNNGVLKWKISDGRDGSDPMKTNPSKPELEKKFKKMFKDGKFTLEIRK